MPLLDSSLLARPNKEFTLVGLEGETTISLNGTLIRVEGLGGLPWRADQVPIITDEPGNPPHWPKDVLSLPHVPVPGKAVERSGLWVPLSDPLLSCPPVLPPRVESCVGT